MAGYQVVPASSFLAVRAAPVPTVTVAAVGVETATSKTVPAGSVTIVVPLNEVLVSAMSARTVVAWGILVVFCRTASVSVVPAGADAAMA